MSNLKDFYEHFRELSLDTLPKQLETSATGTPGEDDYVEFYMAGMKIDNYYNGLGDVYGQYSVPYKEDTKESLIEFVKESQRNFVEDSQSEYNKGYLAGLQDVLEYLEGIV